MGPLTTRRNQPCRHLGLRLQAPQGGHETFLFERLFVALWWTAPAKAHSQPSLPDAVGSPDGTDLYAGTKRHCSQSHKQVHFLLVVPSGERQSSRPFWAQGHGGSFGIATQALQLGCLGVKPDPARLPSLALGFLVCET